MPVDLDSIKSIIEELGKTNSTKEFIKKLLNYIMKHQHEFEADYKGTCRNQRFSSGKLEKEVFLMLATICCHQNRHGNAAKASKVMISLGYYSYEHNPNRFRQKIENLKKIEKNGKKQQKTRQPTKKISGRKRMMSSICENEIEEVYEYTETESMYEEEVNYNANGRLSQPLELTESTNHSLSSHSTQFQIEPEYSGDFGDATPVKQSDDELPTFNQPTDIQESIQLYGLPNSFDQSTEDSITEGDIQNPANMYSVGSCACACDDDDDDDRNSVIDDNKNPVGNDRTFLINIPINVYSDDISDLPAPDSIRTQENCSGMSNFAEYDGYASREGNEEISFHQGNIRDSIVLPPGQQSQEGLVTSLSYNPVETPTQNDPLTSSRNDERTLIDSIHNNKGGAEIEDSKDVFNTAGASWQYLP